MTSVTDFSGPSPYSGSTARDVRRTQSLSVRHLQSGQSQLTSKGYEHSIRNMRTVRQSHLSMPDHHEFVAAAMSKRNTTQLSSMMQFETRSPPYPLYDENVYTQSTHIVHCSHDTYFRQPTAEDFLRQHPPLPPPPVEVCDIDQDLPVIEPDSHVEMDQLEQPIEDPCNSQPAAYNPSIVTCINQLLGGYTKSRTFKAKPRSATKSETR
ncbi:hypothetical protein BM1_09410 [Bipolaris maydis]|nr:hypothetical protein BM1_09410 [Bipolaris maydis]